MNFGTVNLTVQQFQDDRWGLYYSM